MQWASELQREQCDIADLVGLPQVRRVGHDLRPGLQSHGGRRLREARCRRLHAAVRRDDRTHRRRADRRRALRHARSPPEVPVLLRPLRQGRRRPQDQRSLRFAAHQGQHRRRPDHHRREGAGQHPEDRQEVQGRRRARQGRVALRAGPVVHGFVVGRGGDGDALRGRRLRRPFLPHRARATSSAIRSCR